MALSGIIKFTSTTANENILQNTSVKIKIRELMGSLSESDYQHRFLANPINGTKQGLTMKFVILFPTGNKILLNSQAVASDTMESVFDSQGFIQVYAVKVQTPSVGTLMFSIN